MTQRKARVALAVAIAIAVAVTAQAATFSPHPEVGYPAGMLPDCPGMMKNVSISAHNLPYLQVVSHRLADNGKTIRKSFSIASGAKAIAKEKYIDFKNKKTVVYAVGFLDSSAFPHSQALATSYARRGYNVFVSETFTFLTNIYPKSARIARAIGWKLGDFLASLTRQGLTADNLELVGLSLGAHIVAYAAKRLYALTGMKPSRLTGLDPAGPCFRNIDPEFRLNSTDAERVDVVHTNIDGFGIAEPLGNIDFYVNGGEFQPGDILYIPCLIVCSHIRALLYWWQAVEHPRAFIGVKCDSVQDARFAKCYNNIETNYLGLEAKFSRPGIYYLPTSNEFPYFRGKEGLKAENEIFSSSVKAINGDNGLEV